jgi:hypothetical protein
MEVIVAAVVTAISAVIVALITRGVGKMRKAVGQPNGRGSVVQMNERQLDMMEDIQLREAQRDGKIADLAASVSAVNLNLQGIARFQNLISGVRLDFEDRFEEIGNILGELDGRLSKVEKQAEKNTAARFRVPHLPSRHIDHDVNE